MKKMFVTFLMAGIGVVAMAQSTKVVKGAVIDINGNPLPGAKVEATGGAESTVSDADGTFTLEVSQWLKSLSVSYPGMEKKKLSIKNDNRDMIFTMREETSHWFINAVSQYSIGHESHAFGAGVMFGQIGKWGWYGKILADFSHTYEYYDYCSFAPTASVGVIKRISKPFNIYVGVGYSNYYYYDYSYSYYYDSYGYSYGYSSNWTDNNSAMLVEIGALHNIGHFNLNYGGGIIYDFVGNIGANFTIGLGYSF